MHIFLSGAINSQINITLIDNEYINYTTDPRYVELIGYNNNSVPNHGTRSIIGLGCSAASSIKGAAGSMKMQNFKIKYK